MITSVQMTLIKKIKTSGLENNKLRIAETIKLLTYISKLLTFLRYKASVKLLTHFKCLRSIKINNNIHVQTNISRNKFYYDLHY